MIRVEALLASLQAGMLCPDMEAAVDHAISLLGEYMDLAALDHSNLVDGVLCNAKTEEEAEHIPLHALLGQRSPVALGPGKMTLAAMASDYVDATRYLFPILHGYSASLVELSRQKGTPQPIHLFLRDALFFWPSIQAIQEQRGGESINFLMFSRGDDRVRRRPISIQRSSGGAFREIVDARIERGILADVGLYGSLVHSMIKSRFCSPSVSALFLGSGNPFIAGWANSILDAETRRSGGAIDPLHVVRVVDTIESLLKPFRAVRDEDGRVQLTDPISFVCSMAFLWELSRYSRSRGQCGMDLTSHLSEMGSRTPRNAWVIERAVPRWPEADQFVSRWDLGPIGPMDRPYGAGQ